MPRIVPFRNLLARREAGHRSSGWVEPQNEITRALSGSATVRPARMPHPEAANGDPLVEIFAKDTLGVDRPGHSHPDRI